MANHRSRNGFTQNSGNIWGHCEEGDAIGGKHYDCTDRTLYRCDTCKQFVCNSHQKRHTKDHLKEPSNE